MARPGDTIAAIATPPGEGGLGVVRLSGPDAFILADRVFRASHPLTQALSHTLAHGFLVEPDGSVLDEGVAAVFRAPRSYTGEDVAEISCHGGWLLPKRALDLCLAAGARLAGPGEFTRRAFMNGKLDLAQAEAVAELISARSETLRRLALGQLRGRLSEKVKGLRGSALALLASIEANLDFAEEEVPDLAAEVLANKLESLVQGAGALLESNPRLLREGLSAVLVGAPNVGKSSLFNALLAEDRAIVTAIPGTTRDTVEETLLIEEIPVRLVDTAGIRTAAEPIEAEGVARARRAAEGAGTALLVVEAGGPVREEERRLARDLTGRPAVLVINKMDLAGGGEPERWRRELDWTGPTVRVSALRGEGLQELGRALLEAARAGGGDGVPDGVYLNARQEECLRLARDSFQRALGAPEEAAALELRAGLQSLGHITGEGGLSEEVLDAIFSRFCIGK